MGKPSRASFKFAPANSPVRLTFAAAPGALPLKPFEFQGYFGNRRVQSFGFRYDYGLGGVELAEAPPPFLEPLLSKVAEFAGHAVQGFRQIGISEYRPGSCIGWHRDKPTVRGRRRHLAPLQG